MDWGEVAKAAARASTCKKRQVGAVLVWHGDEVDILMGVGCSGPPRAAICEWRNGNGKDRDCFHAEWEAMHNATGNIYGATLYVTRTPCEGLCAEKIKRFEIKVVVVDDNDKEVSHPNAATHPLSPWDSR